MEKTLPMKVLSFKIRSHVMKGNGTESMSPRKIKSPNNFKGMSKEKQELQESLYKREQPKVKLCRGVDEGLCFNCNKMGCHFKDCPKPK
jgi:hypothetical protein